jgi:hypothetical protein
MDPKNRFHTRGSYRLARAEHLAVVAVAGALSIAHAAEIDWWRYAAAFWVIDVVGYLPGAIAYRRRGGGPIPPLYHHIYNAAHTYLAVGTGLALWAAWLGGWEWAMLGAIIHLSIDRGVFGNVFKPSALAFEPVATPPDEVARLLDSSVDREDAPVPCSAAPCDPSRILDHPSGYLALSARNRFFTASDIDGFIPYRERGRHFIAFGGIHAEQAVRERLLDAFIAEANRRKRGVIVVQARENQVALFQSRGFTVNQFGTSFTLRLRGYTLGGTRKMKLRNKISRARAAGLRVVEVGREIARDEAAFDLLRSISAAWLADKGKKELDFMVGEIGTPEDPARRIFLTLDPQDRPVSFITYVPVWGDRPGYLHDLTRKLPDAPVGAMELCNAEAMQRFSNEGVEFLHLGFTPFVTQGDEPSSASRLVTWFVGKLRKYGKAVYPAEAQASYKLKWGPDILEPEFFAARPLSLRAVVDTLVITRSI